MAETGTAKKVVHVGDVLGEKQNLYTVYDAKDVLEDLSFAGLYPSDTRVGDWSPSLVERVKRYYGEKAVRLTAREVAVCLASIAAEFDVERDIVRITRDELWLRTRPER